jgi:hypothetical protein
MKIIRIYSQPKEGSNLKLIRQDRYTAKRVRQYSELKDFMLKKDCYKVVIEIQYPVEKGSFGYVTRTFSQKNTIQPIIKHSIS